MSDPAVISKNLSDLTDEDISTYIKNKKDFVVNEVKNMSTFIKKLEKLMTQHDMKCRVYSEYRGSLMASVAIPTPATIGLGLATAAFVGIHKAVTFSPDYEIGKSKIWDRVTVTYKK